MLPANQTMPAVIFRTRILCLTGRVSTQTEAVSLPWNGPVALSKFGSSRTERRPRILKWEVPIQRLGRSQSPNFRGIVIYQVTSKTCRSYASLPCSPFSLSLCNRTHCPSRTHLILPLSFFLSLHVPTTTANHIIHQIINTDFCGTWAGSVWNTSTYCSSLAPTCDDYVRYNPAKFQDAYWLINSLIVYQYQSDDGNMPSPPTSHGSAAKNETAPLLSTPLAMGGGFSYPPRHRGSRMAKIRREGQDRPG